MTERACSIVIRDNKFLFIEQMVNDKPRCVFIGGRVEDGETPQEAVLRELSEEANVEGEIVFGPAVLTTGMRENVFIVSIPENATPVLGYDPELPIDKQQIKRLIWRDANEEIDMFNSFDKKYFSTIVDEAKKQSLNGEWITILDKIIAHNPAE